MNQQKSVRLYNIVFCKKKKKLNKNGYFSSNLTIKEQNPDVKIFFVKMNMLRNSETIQALL